MPIYQYTCKVCKECFEKITFKITTDSEVICPKCGSNETEKIPSRGGFKIEGFSEANGYARTSEEISYDGRKDVKW